MTKIFAIVGALLLTGCSTTWDDKKEELVTVMKSSIVEPIPEVVLNSLTNCVADAAIDAVKKSECPVPEKGSYKDIRDPINQCLENSPHAQEFQFKFMQCLMKAQQDLLKSVTQ